jgi:hypothetical protein
LGQADLYKQGHWRWVFRASTNCPTDGLLLDPWCKPIAPNVFSSVSWFRFRVSRILNFFSSFSCLHRCCNKPPSLCRRGTNLFTFFPENGPVLYLTNSILPVFQVQNLASDTTEAIEEAVNFLNKCSCW